MATKKEQTNQTAETTKETNNQASSQNGLKPSNNRNDFRAKAISQQAKIDAENDAKMYFQSYNQHLNSLLDRGTVTLAKRHISEATLYPEYESIQDADFSEEIKALNYQPTLFLP